MPRRPKIPSYMLHQSTGQARCRIGGKDYYLGRFGTPESKERYNKLIADWLAGNFNPRALEDSPNNSSASHKTSSAPALTVAMVLELYLEHAKGYYRKGGKMTLQVDRVERAIKEAVAKHGSTAAIMFGTRALKEIRRQMVAKDWARSYVNSLIGCLVRAWGWAVSEELVPGESAHALREVPSLREGEDGVREGRVIGPVPWASVEAVRPFLRPCVADLLTVQYLAGARPTEACHLRACDIAFDGRLADGPTFPGVWVYVVRPEANKTHHRGKKRIIFLGPRAQEILSPYIATCDPTDYLFSPARDRPSAQGQRAPGERYTTHSLYTAVRRACKLAKVPLWSPNQLRKTKATEIRASSGLDVAGAVLGHSHLATTLIYAQEDLEKAAEVMKKTG